MRGSDEGTDMVIAGTIKGLAEEVSLQLPTVSRQENYQKFVTFIEDTANKMSHADLEARKKKYSIGLEKNRKVTKSERSSCGIDVPAGMDSGLKIKDTQKKHGKEIKVEISSQRICRVTRK